MDSFKIAHFQREYNIEFPKIIVLEIAELRQIQYNFILVFKLGEAATLMDLLNAMRMNQTVLAHVNADADEFNLLELFTSQHIIPHEFIYINWYRFDVIDKLKFSDLCEYFTDIWYPSSDDIDIFDDSFQWIISISYDGVIYRTN